MTRRVRDTTMLFKPLAYASALDHTTLRLSRVIVEAFWSPALYSRP
jgi:hypothetical protein